MGFMAVGKSTVGRILASRLGVTFVDTDAEIEKSEGRSIAKIFHESGEAYFRKLEHDYLKQLPDMTKSVIATGGGMPCSRQNIALIKKYSHSVHLKLGVENITSRLANDKVRPLVQGKSRLEILKLVKSKLKVRNPYYSKGDLSVMAYKKPELVADRILVRIKRSTK